MGGPTVRLLICAGGTGGGVYPALAVLQALERHDREIPDGEGDFLDQRSTPLQASSAHRYLWVGGFGGMEVDLVKREGIAFEPIPAADLSGR